MLSRFKPGERAAVEEAVAQAAQAVLVWVRQGIDVVHEPGERRAEAEKPKKEKPAKDKTDKTPGRRTHRRDDRTTETREIEPAMPVNSYECLFLLDPTKTATDMDGVKTQLHDTLEKYGAEIVASRKWDDRKLAYPIKGHKKGVYHLTTSRSDSKKIAEIDHDFRLNEVDPPAHDLATIDPKWDEEMLAVARDDHRFALQVMHEESPKAGLGPPRPAGTDRAGAEGCPWRGGRRPARGAARGGRRRRRSARSELGLFDLLTLADSLAVDVVKSRGARSKPPNHPGSGDEPITHQERRPWPPSTR